MLNALPEARDIPLKVICSVLVSVCCAQDDPAATFQIIGANTAVAIKTVLAEPEGSAR